MIVLRVHDNDGVEYFLAGAGADAQDEPLIISMFFELFHDQFVGVAATAINILLCFEDRVLRGLARAVNHERHEFPLVTRLEGRGRPLELRQRVQGLVEVAVGHVVNVLLRLQARGHQGHLGDGRHRSCMAV